MEEEEEEDEADLTRELLERLPNRLRVPSSAVFPSIITACYPSCSRQSLTVRRSTNTHADPQQKQTHAGGRRKKAQR